MSNKLIIAAAGSGKTTLLVKEALAQKNGKDTRLILYRHCWQG